MTGCTHGIEACASMDSSTSSADAAAAWRAAFSLPDAGKLAPLSRAANYAQNDNHSVALLVGDAAWPTPDAPAATPTTAGAARRRHQAAPQATPPRGLTASSDH